MDKLPTELRNVILGYLDDEPPSTRCLTINPSPNLLASTERPLKHLSLVSHSWRALVLLKLFKYCQVRLDLREPVESVHERTKGTFSPFLRLLHHRGLMSNVYGLAVFILSDPNSNPDEYFSNSSTPPDDGRGLRPHAEQAQWPRLIPYLPLRRLLLLASPPWLASLFEAKIRPRASSSFEIPLQALQLVRFSNQPLSRSFSPSSSSAAQNLGPWTHLSLHDGSCLPFFTTSEYNAYYYATNEDLMKKSLSLLSTVAQDKSNVLWGAMGSQLTWLEYTMIYPLQHHTRSFSTLLFFCPHLEKLRVQLGACHGGQATEYLGGNLQINDLRREVKEAYRSLLGGVSRMGYHGVLREFVSRDCSDLGQMSSLEGYIDSHLLGWERTDRGIWIRHEAFDEFLQWYTGGLVVGVDPSAWKAFLAERDPSAGRDLPPLLS